MAIQKCPRCNSDRIRHGYRPTSIFKKITFRYNLLCDACNWEFVGFAIPGTVPSKSRKKRPSDHSESKVQAIIEPVISKATHLEKSSKTEELLAPLENIKAETPVILVESISDPEEIAPEVVEVIPEKKIVIDTVIAAPIEVVVAEEPVSIDESSVTGETEEAVKTKNPSVKRIKVKKKKRVKTRL